MDNIIKGKVYVVGNNVDTDQIIPARHLVYNMEDPKERRIYGIYAMSGIPEDGAGLPGGKIPFILKNEDQSYFKIVVSGKNFGCGSSREHAPAALSIAGVKAVIAVSYARIFYRNAVDGGFLIPYESQTDLSREIKTGDELTIRPDINLLKNESIGKSYHLKPLGEVAGIVQAGGIFAFAAQKKMIN